jgi:hypothetical protein
MKTAEVTALHEDDLLAFLELVGVADAYRDGTLRCVICEQPLIERGIGAARRAEDESFEFSCARLDCLEKFHR